MAAEGQFNAAIKGNPEAAREIADATKRLLLGDKPLLRECSSRVKRYSIPQMSNSAQHYESE